MVLFAVKPRIFSKAGIFMYQAGLFGYFLDVSFKIEFIYNMLFFISFLLVFASFFFQKDSPEKIPILSIDKNKVYIYPKQQLFANKLYVQLEKEIIESLELKTSIFNTKIIAVFYSKDKGTYNLPSLNKRNRLYLISFLEDNLPDKLI